MLSRSAHRLAAALALLLLTGCFGERSVRIRPDRLAGLTSGGDRPCAADAERPELTARAWLRQQHARLAYLLPASSESPLMTEELTDQRTGTAVNMAEYFGVDPERLHTIVHNYDGIAHTAQAAGRANALDAPAPPWPGFEDVWAPVDFDPFGLELSCRLGFATHPDGSPRMADCIVLLPGIFGDNAVTRTRDIAMALRESGLHVCAVELRGCGQTQKRFPDHPMMFGVLETGDLLALSEWLEATPHVRRTGLVGFCWGSNIALLTAWDDARSSPTPEISPALQARLRPPSDRRHFQAGILVFSAVLPFEDVADKTDTPVGMLTNPVINKLEGEVAFRQNYCGYRNPNSSLWKLIDEEYARAPGAYPGSVLDGRDFLRLYPYRERLFTNKLEVIQVPTLFVHAANDPLTDAQPLANLIAQTENPNVAAIVLPGGGHVGFGPWAPDYFYALLLSFFDPDCGAGAGAPPVLN